MVKVIADSTCDLSEELIRQYDISILPLHILLGEDEYRDSKEISPNEIYEWSDTNKQTPKTSAPSLEDAIKLFQPYIENGNEIICFSISDEMSTSANVMRIAAEELEAQDKIFVINSKNLSTGIGLLVIEAAIRAKQGKSAQKIVNEIEKMIPKVRASFVVDVLTYLYRGGRCNGLSAMVGAAIKLHPKIVVVDGVMKSDKKYRGKMKSVLISYVKDMEEIIKNSKKDRVFITHSGCDEEIIDSVYNYLKKLNYFEEILVTKAGGVISSHCGPGTLGVLFIENTREE